MVEELIAEGVSPEDIVTYMMVTFGYPVEDAWLQVNTALGLPGDVLESVEDAEFEDDVDDDDEALVAAGFDESKVRRYEAGRREGGRFAPKDGTSTAVAQQEAEDQAAAAQAGEMSTEEMRRNEVMKYAVSNGVAETPAATQPGVVGNVKKMNVNATNPVYVGELDGTKVVVKPQSQLSATRLRNWVEPGFDLEREQAAAHVATLLREDTPSVAPNVLSYQVADVAPFGPSGVTPFVEGETLARMAVHSPGLVGKSIAPDIRRIRLYDGIIGNTDRHEGNVMIGPAQRVYAIDHGLAFPSVNQEDFTNLQGGALLTPLDDNERGALERLRPRLKADTVLPTLLTDDQIRAMDDRIGFMLDRGRLVSSTDWEQGLQNVE